MLFLMKVHSGMIPTEMDSEITQLGLNPMHVRLILVHRQKTSLGAKIAMGTVGQMVEMSFLKIRSNGSIQIMILTAIITILIQC